MSKVALGSVPSMVNPGAGGSFAPFQFKTTMSWGSDGVVLRLSRQSFPRWLNFLQLGHGVRGFFSSGHPHCPSLVFLQLYHFLGDIFPG